MAITKVTAGKDAAGERLDRFLAHQVPGMTTARAKELLEQGRVRIRGKVCKPLRKLWGGEEIEVDLPAPRAAQSTPAGTQKLPILYEDEALVVVDKPAGITVEAEGRAASVAAAVAAQVAGLDVAGEAMPGVAHRLDRETTGCVALAKTDAALAALVRAFDEKRVRKTYLAIVLGEPPDSARLEGPYNRDPKNPRLYTTHVASARRAALSYRVVERLKGAALVEVQLETGRTHQIRVQLSESGFPVLADSLYGTDAARRHPAAVAIGRQALHAWRLELPRAATGEPVRIEAPIPADFERALAMLR